MLANATKNEKGRVLLHLLDAKEATPEQTKIMRNFLIANPAHVIPASYFRHERDAAFRSSDAFADLVRRFKQRRDEPDAARVFGEPAMARVLREELADSSPAAVVAKTLVNRDPAWTRVLFEGGELSRSEFLASDDARLTHGWLLVRGFARGDTLERYESSIGPLDLARLFYRRPTEWNVDFEQMRWVRRRFGIGTWAEMMRLLRGANARRESYQAVVDAHLDRRAMAEFYASAGSDALHAPIVRKKLEQLLGI